jgi:thiol-disulfide isomerase/thioredoxin
MMRAVVAGVALVLGSLSFAAVAAGQADNQPQADDGIKRHGGLALGRWRAWVQSPGGQIPFIIETSAPGGVFRAVLINGSERMEVPVAEAADGSLAMQIDIYDALILATSRKSGTVLDGWYHKRRGPTDRTQMLFGAVHGDEPRFPALTGGTPIKMRIDGRWLVNFEDSDDPAIATFRTESDGTVSGTFETPTGDYRFLAGTFEQGRLRLSAFDGAHAFLFDASVLPGGRLAGDFWSGAHYHTGWAAERTAEDTALPDAWSMSEAPATIDFASIRYPDTNGVLRSLDEFAGEKGTVIEIFGTWCPNCRDATRDLIDLHDRYAKQGIGFVALAVELTGDAARDARLVRTYKQRLGVPYPMLVAGERRAAKASFPLVDKLRAFPTTLFVQEDGTVTAVHTGYSGPATGEAHTKLKAQYVEQIEALR